MVLSVVVHRAVRGPTLLVLVALLVYPVFGANAAALAVVTGAMIYALGAIGLDLLAFSGQFSFGQFGYYAIGAYAMVNLMSRFGWPFLAAAAAAVTLCGLVGLALGRVFTRLAHFGAAMGTFFFSIVVATLLPSTRWGQWTGGSSGLPVPPVSVGPWSLGDSRTMYFVTWFALALGAVFALRYMQTRSGIAVRVLKQNETLAEVLGIRVRQEKARAHMIAAGLAGLGGCTYAAFLGFLSPEAFQADQSILIFAAAAVGGLGSIAGPIMGAVFYFVVTKAAHGLTGAASAIVFCIAMLLVFIFFEAGLFGALESLMRSVRRSIERAIKRPLDLPFSARRVAGSATPFEPSASVVPAPPRQDAATGLAVHDLTVSYGGLKAVSNVSVSVAPGEIHAVIGPNGAGKTTLLNCINGIEPAAAGRVTMNGHDITGADAGARRAAGIARTFQHASLAGDLTVLENVAIGAYVSHRRSLLLEIIGTPGVRALERNAETRARYALTLIGFNPARWDTVAADLTMGEQKRVDIARGLAAAPSVILVDEPTAGLDGDQIALVADALQRVSRAGVGVLVIAHHIGFIRNIASRATVLNFGEVVATGTPRAVLQEPAVIDIFAGLDEVEAEGVEANV